MTEPDDSSPQEADEDLLQEFRIQYERTISRKDTLDDKANNIITMAGAVTTLFLGFGGFLLKDIAIPDDWLFSAGAIFFIGGIIIAIYGISFAFRAYSIQKWWYPIGDVAFRSNPNLVREAIEVGKKEFRIHQIEQYISSIEINNRVNDQKVEQIRTAQRLYLIGLSMIGPFALVIVIAKFLSL